MSTHSTSTSRPASARKPRGRIAQWVAMWAALAIIPLGSCSLVVDPENSDVRCVAQSGKADPCSEIAANMVCREGTCQECVPGSVVEDCDRIDNDCDGLIDEGNDQDGDGFTWCGGGIRALADCVDTDPNIHPIGDRPDGTGDFRDFCGDGIDNDCSGVPDDDVSCEGTGNCEDLDTPCSVPGTCVTCPVGQQCEPCPSDRNCGSRATICVAPLNPGSACTLDSDCQSGLCVEAAALGLSADAGKVCSLACCSDADCGDNNICLVRGNGTRLCAPPGLVGRVSLRQGQPCERSTDCSSGVCDPGSDGAAPTCRRLCTSDLDCVGSPHGSACLFQSAGFLSSVGFACGTPRDNATGETGSFCIPSTNTCRSDFCIPSPIFVSACNESCRTDCSGERTTCAYESIADFFPGTPRMPLCVLSEGSTGLGQSCGDENGCAEGRCISGTCRSTCCNDSDCGELRCRPVSTRDGYGMYCTP